MRTICSPTVRLKIEEFKEAICFYIAVKSKHLTEAKLCVITVHLHEAVYLVLVPYKAQMYNSQKVGLNNTPFHTLRMKGVCQPFLLLAHMHKEQLLIWCKGQS